MEIDAACIPCNLWVNCVAAYRRNSTTWVRMPVSATRIHPIHWVRIGLEVLAGGAAYFGGFHLLTIVFSGQIEWVAALYTISTLVAIIAFVIWKVYQSIRKEKYANITASIHNINHALRDLQTYVLSHRPPQRAPVSQVETFCSFCRERFEKTLTELRIVFTSLTGTHCRTSIKLVYPVGKEYYYYTLTRDQGSAQQLRQLDNKRVTENHDLLKKNKPFSRLFGDDNETWHYISNDLTCDPEFMTTSITAYDPDAAERAVIAEKGLFGLRRKKEKWVLPYKSTIACIVRQGVIDSAPGGKSVAVGFLTVDSESRNVFESRWDVELMFSVADALFHPLRSYLEVLNQETEQDAGQKAAIQPEHVGGN